MPKITPLRPKHGSDLIDQMYKKKNLPFASATYLFLVFAFCASGARASDPVFTNDGKHVFARGELVKKADPATFRALSHDLGVDKNHVFLVGFGHEGETGTTILDGVDPATFNIIDDFFVKDAFKVFTRPAFPSINSLPGADPMTFVSLKKGYGRDVKKLYYRALPIDGADLKSLRIIEAENANLIRDKNSVYDSGKKIAGADPETFQVLTYGWARDKKNLYHLSISGEGAHVAKIQPKVHVPSFAILDSKYAKDSQAAYSSVCRGPEAVRVENTSLSPWCIISEADPQSFSLNFKIGPAVNLLTDSTFGFAKDSKRVFYDGAPLNGADHATFELLHPIGYAKDKARVYLREKVIVGADPKTFELVDPQNWITKDKKQTFFQDRVK